MRVLLTGQVGLDKSAYLEGVREAALSQGRKVTCWSIGSRMIKNHGRSVTENAILNLSDPLLECLRGKAWADILRELEREGDAGVHVVNTHAVFRWRHGLFPAQELDWVCRFAPDVVVVLVDYVLDVKRALRERDTDFFQLWELLAWREEEVWFSKFIADSAKKILKKSVAFFVAPKKQGPRLLARLLENPAAPKVYLSFPITGLPEAEKDEINDFKKRISQEFIAFDPGTIEDRALVLLYQTAEEESREEEPIRSPLLRAGKLLVRSDVPEGDTLEIPTSEVVAVLEAIDSQIISRDHLLIDQSDFVMVYIASDRDSGSRNSAVRPRVSAGCQSEIVYAYETGKEVYVIFKGGEKRLSPWITQFSRVFIDVEAAYNHVRSRYS